MPDNSPKRKIRDSVFTHLFQEKKYLLQLYQALHPEDGAVTEDEIADVTLKHVLVDADYSQIELRLLAHIAEDEAMREAFLAGGDFHAETAAKVFHVDRADVTHEMRRRAKAVNFGIVYGISQYGLAKQIDVSNEEAKKYIAQHFQESDFSLNKIAVEIGISASYFSSIFKQKTGQSFVEYLTKMRIEKACELLKCTTLRTAEIGEQVGYHDPHYFSATFKKVMGQSPKDYKNDSNR